MNLYALFYFHFGKYTHLFYSTFFLSMKRAGKIWIWFLCMAGLVFAMLQIVNHFRGTRGEEHIQEAYRLLEQSEYSKAILQLEEAQRTFDLVGEDFPEQDTLFGLYLRTQDWEAAYNMTNHEGFANRFDDSQRWLDVQTRFLEKTIDSDTEYKAYVAAEVVIEDPTLSLRPYSPEIMELLSQALGDWVISNGYLNGFTRQQDWSNSTQEWWSYVADDNEEIDLGPFHATMSRAFPNHDRLIVDLFRPFDNEEPASTHMAYVGRIEYRGPGLADSAELRPEEAIHDSLDRNHERLQAYRSAFGWDRDLLYWHTAQQSLLGSTVNPAVNHFYLYFRERVKMTNQSSLLELVVDRGLLVPGSGLACDSGDQVDCWEVQHSAISGFPKELVEILLEKFPPPSRGYFRPDNQREAQMAALAVGLATYKELKGWE